MNYNNSFDFKWYWRFGIGPNPKFGWNFDKNKLILINLIILKLITVFNGFMSQLELCPQKIFKKIKNHCMRNCTPPVPNRKYIFFNLKILEIFNNII